MDRFREPVGQVLLDGVETRDVRHVVKDNVLRIGDLRPALVVIPPGVWHGLQNIGDRDAAVIDLVDNAYDYEDPDHWRAPADAPEIPFSWN